MKHWVFDLDNTLIHSFPHYLESLEAILNTYGHSLGQPDVHKLASLPAAKILGGFLPPSEVPKALDYLRVKALEETDRVPTFEGVREILDHLESAADSVSLWTNRDRETTEAVLRDSGLERYFVEIVTSSCVKNPKPSPEGLHVLATRLQAAPQDIVMVGDHEFDVHGAHAAGAKTVRAGWSELVRERCQMAHQHFHTIPEFLTWLKTHVPLEPSNGGPTRT